MSFGDKFSKFKQFTLQSVGKAEKTSEGEEFGQMITTMKETKIELQNFLDLAKKFHKSQQDAAESLEKLSGAMQKVNFQDTTAKSNMLEAVPMVSKCSAGSVEFLNTFKVTIIDVLNSILEIQFKQAEKAWKKVEDGRLEYDSSAARFKATLENTKKSTQEEIDRAKQKADDAETAYNTAKEQCVEACAALAKEKEQFAHNQIPSLANMLGENGASYCAAAQSYIEASSK